MAEWRGQRFAGQWSARSAAAVALATVTLCACGGVAWALWASGGVATGPANPVVAWTLPATATTCTDTDGEVFESAEVTWPETSTPHILDYTATINDEPAPITDNGTTRSVTITRDLLVEMFGALSSGTLTVRVTAFLPATSWTAPVATETLQADVATLPPGLTLECTSPP